MGNLRMQIYKHGKLGKSSLQCTTQVTGLLPTFCPTEQATVGHYHPGSLPASPRSGSSSVCHSRPRSLCVHAEAQHIRSFGT